VGTDIASVKISIEHWEEGYMRPEVRIGLGTLQDPGSIAATYLQAHMSESNKFIDVWDITQFVSTPQDVNTLKVVIKNKGWWDISVAVDKIDIQVECN
jgi:hypothetical protein